MQLQSLKNILWVMNNSYWNLIDDTGSGRISGSGTNLKLALWTPNGTTLGNSLLSQSGTTSTSHLLLHGDSVVIWKDTAAATKSFASKYFVLTHTGGAQIDSLYSAIFPTLSGTDTTVAIEKGFRYYNRNLIHSVLFGVGCGISFNKAVANHAITAFGYHVFNATKVNDDGTGGGFNTFARDSLGDCNTGWGSSNGEFLKRDRFNEMYGCGAMEFATDTFGPINSVQNNCAFGVNTNYFARSTNNQICSYNTCMGNFSLTNNLYGSENVAIGFAAMEGPARSVVTGCITGNYNAAGGAYAMQLITSGSNNSAWGHGALNTDSSGSHNSALGMNALANTSNGSANTGIGESALSTNTTGSYNISLGYVTDVTKTNLNNAGAIGSFSKAKYSNNIAFDDSADNVTYSFGTAMNSATVTVKGSSGTTLRIIDGNQGNGKILTSDANGQASWTPSMFTTKSITTPANGGTVNLVINTQNLINPAATIATCTINLPSAPSDNDKVYIKLTNAITTITWGNGTLAGSQSSLTSGAAGQIYIFTYDSGTSKWY
jgi:hypothetical protein